MENPWIEAIRASLCSVSRMKPPFIDAPAPKGLDRAVLAFKVWVNQPEEPIRDISHLKWLAVPQVLIPLATMPYERFLQTSYWDCIKGYMLYAMSGVCHQCRARDVELDLHHRWYFNRGREVHHLEDVEVLCFRCHDKFHREFSSKFGNVGRWVEAEANADHRFSHRDAPPKSAALEPDFFDRWQEWKDRKDRLARRASARSRN